MKGTYGMGNPNNNGGETIVIAIVHILSITW
jgi:hypothetical protein